MENNATRDADIEKMKTSPTCAKKRLEYMGFEEDRWSEMLEGGLGSHEVRALITIARGSEPKLLGEIYKEMRKQDGLPAERPKR